MVATSASTGIYCGRPFGDYRLLPIGFLVKRGVADSVVINRSGNGILPHGVLTLVGVVVIRLTVGCGAISGRCSDIITLSIAFLHIHREGLVGLVDLNAFPGPQSGDGHA